MVAVHVRRKDIGELQGWAPQVCVCVVGREGSYGGDLGVEGSGER